MQWFLKEQVEEVASMKTLLTIADRAGHNLFDLEEFVAREMNTSVVADAAHPPSPADAPNFAPRDTHRRVTREISRSYGRSSDKSPLSDGHPTCVSVATRLSGRTRLSAG